MRKNSLLFIPVMTVALSSGMSLAYADIVKCQVGSGVVLYSDTNTVCGGTQAARVVVSTATVASGNLEPVIIQTRVVSAATPPLPAPRQSEWAQKQIVPKPPRVDVASIKAARLKLQEADRDRVHLASR